MIFEAGIVIVITGSEATIKMKGETTIVCLSSAEGKLLLEAIAAHIRGEDYFERPMHTVISDFVQNRLRALRD